VLRREGIDHALIGAAAMAVHGISRATIDIDLLTVDVRALEASLWTPFEARGNVVRLIKGDFDDPLAGSVRLTEPGGSVVDVVVGRYEWQNEIVRSSEPSPIDDVEIPVVRPAGLVVLKLFAGGPKDAWDVTALAEAREDWPRIRGEVDSSIDRLPADSRRLWARLCARSE